MLTKRVALAVFPVLIAFLGLSQTPLQGESAKPDMASGEKAFVGIWRGNLEGLPAATITVTHEGGSLSGAVVFYLHRKTPGSATTVTPGTPEPLLHPRIEGQRLTFEVSHHHAHPPKSLEDPPIVMEMRLTGDGQATLVNKEDAGVTTTMMRTSD